MIGSLFTRFFTWITRKIDWRIGWYRLPVPLGLLDLIGLRILLRQKNLYDTALATKSTHQSPPRDDTRYLIARTADGTYNDLDIPTMGSVGTRFGRNVPLNHAYPDESAILIPNPRVISLELLTRDTFQPATSLSLLAASWVQFMIHDWFSHGKNQKKNPWEVPLAEDDPCRNIQCESFARTRIQLARTIPRISLPHT